MKRLAPILLLVAVLAAFVFHGVGDDLADPHGLTSPSVRLVEERIGGGDLDGARQEIARGDGLSSVAVVYLESALALAEGRYDDALDAARRAGAQAPGDWRPFSVEYAALVALERRAEAGRLARAAVAAMPSDERVLAMAAHDYVSSADNADPAAALALLDRIDALPERKAGPDDPTAVGPQQLVRIRFMAETASERFTAALGTARTLRELAPDDPTMNLFVGEAARRAGDLPAAAAAYRAAVDAVPQATPWRENLVQILLELPDSTQEALEQSAELMAVAPSSRSVRILRARVLVRAEEILPEGPDQAVTIYRQLLREKSEDPVVLRNLAVLLYDWKQGGREGLNLDEAHAHLRRYVRLGGEIDDELAGVWEALEGRAAARGEDDPARIAAREFDAAPSSPRKAAALIEQLVAAGREDEVGAVVRRAVAAAPDNPAVRVLAARHFAEEGTDHDPEAAYGHITAAAPALGGLDGLPEPLQWLRCRLALATERFGDAYASAGLLLDAHPGEPPYLGGRGEAALGLGRAEEAERHLRAAAAADPSPERMTTLARALLALPGRTPDAIALLEEALVAGGRTPERGRLYARALLAFPERRDEGVLVLQAFVQTYPDDVPGIGLLAAVVHRLGNADLARGLLRRYRELGGRREGDVIPVWDALLGDGE